ncbi:hypothetical protein [Luteimonas terricola]|uniref:HTH araC/xylS-type domain-containing protein n=1 Tax=Luteimonas terricola TaxID=645597 RepID=A0ABQ2EBY2_9GAMM|nr:hypothetical protein [Luteimonas terricola]GGK05891.1 hypothetical protein GCM10011394_13830 [Luteimonas terricola]
MTRNAPDLPIEQTATEAGFGTALSLRQHFAAQLGTPPSAYRRNFCGDGSQRLESRAAGRT